MRLFSHSAVVGLLIGTSLVLTAPRAGAAPGAYLSVPEARYQVQSFLQRVESDNADVISSRRVGHCRRGSSRRVSCLFSEKGTDGDTGARWRCRGKVRVVEYAGRYTQRAYGVDCGRP